MDTESVGSCSSPLDLRSPFREEIRPAQNAPDRVALYQRSNACFSCKQEGHWQKDCPLRFKPGLGLPRPLTGPAAGGGRDYPERQCPCGAGPCVVFTSRTEKNPNRDFYRCPVLPKEKKCAFFLWCDEADPVRGANSPVKPDHNYGAKSPVKMNQKMGVTLDPTHPKCSCGAGPCRILTMGSGEHADRKYYGCAIKKGQGACNHFQWCDNSANTYEPKKNHGNHNTRDHRCDGTFRDHTLVPKDPKGPNVDGVQAIEINGGIILEEVPKPHSQTLRNNVVVQGFSPDEWLEEDLLKPMECIKCHKEWHLESECVASPSSVVNYEGHDGRLHVEQSNCHEPKNHVDETERNHGGEDEFPNNILVPDEPNNPKKHLQEATKLMDGGGENRLPISTPAVMECPEMHIQEENEAKDDKNPKEALAPTSPLSLMECGEMHIQEVNEAKDDKTSKEDQVPTSPLSPLAKQDHYACGVDSVSSPIKRLNLGVGSPSKPRKCLRCHREGHWMSDCATMPTYFCFKCGEYGHWSNNCPA